MIIIDRQVLSILSLIVAGLHAYVDTVIPATLREKEDSVSGTRAERLEKNVHLLAVLSLQQQGWQLYGAYWYRLFEIDLMWIPAENYCRAMGGHLVSIRDRAENDFVHTLRKKNNVWIGLNKLNGSLVYHWSDGTSAQYLNWDSTQPNEPRVHCVYMLFNQDQSGMWHDYGCHQQLPQYFVCKLRL